MSHIVVRCRVLGDSSVLRLETKEGCAPGAGTPRIAIGYTLAMRYRAPERSLPLLCISLTAYECFRDHAPEVLSLRSSTTG